MPEDRTPIDHGLAHPPPGGGTIPQPKPQADDDQRELVPSQKTTNANPQRGVAGRDGFVQQPD